MAKVSIIAAISKEKRALGKDNQLLWNISEDLKRFKRITLGHPIIMGRKTYESIGRPLPGRTNIVVSKNKGFKAEGCLIFGSLEEAIDEAKRLDIDEIFIIGGGEIYKQTLPLADKLYLTLVEDEMEADTYFPDYSGFEKTREERGEQGELKFSWVDLERDLS
ncbi:MAG: hypothetical protein COT89_03130 [Candidatus Colwellbacteria bacterium CG10_big_fil_rev_8_21_14_0_10_42_22]|uniref:Dihydrofolate reductase n=1 Tax=Candidatus Colwellbacteria bacterium CG10_big_fil_rev_8_21_14_0_10_42_22 TaxID=1974540 RepID=A0A2H0VF63_9BACT|nr:MAG: hypothetical protein COT89_03130 [Candidatus Colwellbacteria bacterium CG10_big_fil_rev_8_21_14_0_10_42_22]